MKLGVALSGGGIRGMAHIGVLKALEEEDIQIDSISGTSAGAIIAGLYAYGYSAVEIEKLVHHSINGIIDVNYRGILTSLLNFKDLKTRGLSGLIKGERLEDLFKKLTNDCWICDTQIPIAIPAVGVHNGVTYYFSSRKIHFIGQKHKQGIQNIKLYEAMRASMAFPALFVPKKLHRWGQEVWLMDGGVTDNLPISILMELGAQKVIGVHLGYNGRIMKEVDSFIEIGEQALSIMMYYREKEFYKQTTKNIYILNPEIWNVSLLQIKSIQQCIDQGYQSMKVHLPIIQKQWEKFV
ncbi:MAG: patatin-like phospholipase family protein [Epulopiscium sp.]|nr:patatin-like phospholipase family protein [Candidatus Epulonipiscium sp.]